MGSEMCIRDRFDLILSFKPTINLYKSSVNRLQSFECLFCHCLIAESLRFVLYYIKYNRHIVGGKILNFRFFGHKMLQCQKKTRYFSLLDESNPYI